MLARARWVCVVVGLGWVTPVASLGCDAMGTEDAGADTVDAPSGACREDVDCDDALYCNGAERCAPGAATADARGCTLASAGPCPDGCEEATDMCTTCATPDVDGDGHPAIACGGGDCDDEDAQRSPGNAEICDDENHDEDCDPTTLGDRDADGDGYVDAACCNAAVCGDDCNDADRGVHPDLPDLCGDGVDQDCDDGIDEGGVLYLDLDNDGRGDPSTGIMRTCSEGLVANGDDCDDRRADTYGGPIAALEHCDGVDSDCSLPGALAGGADLGEDADGDGHAPAGVCEGGWPADDCDDADPRAYGGNTEDCDGVDSDCDAATSELALACGASSYCLAAGECRAQTLAQVEAGAQHTCARLGEIVRCWGSGDFGQLGDGTTESRRTPTSVPGLVGVAGVWTGGFHTCARLADRVRCWGANDRGQLGDGTTTSRPTPTEVPGLSNVVEVKAGGDHACARLGDGTVRCWGGNSAGQLGDGTTTDRSSPTEVPGLSDVVALSAGGGHTCARLASGAARCWGFNDYGQLGDGTTTSRSSPTAVTGLTDVVEIRAGTYHTCARLAGGSARCWGDNTVGQLGDGTMTSRLSPNAVSGLSGVAGLTVGLYHTCARLTGGAARCWGLNSVGQLGDGTITRRLSPTDVPGLSGAVGLTAGEGHTCARLGDGTARCWGLNNRGQLGDGTMTNRLTPTAVVGL